MLSRAQTESCKLILPFLTHAAKDAAASTAARSAALSAQLHATNPLLESFGNAKTVSLTRLDLYATQLVSTRLRRALAAAGSALTTGSEVLKRGPSGRVGLRRAPGSPRPEEASNATWT